MDDDEWMWHSFRKVCNDKLLFNTSDLAYEQKEDDFYPPFEIIISEDVWMEDPYSRDVSGNGKELLFNMSELANNQNGVGFYKHHEVHFFLCAYFGILPWDMYGPFFFDGFLLNSKFGPRHVILQDKCIKQLLNKKQDENFRLTNIERLGVCSSKKAQLALFKTLTNRKNADCIRKAAAQTIANIWAMSGIDYKKLIQIESQLLDIVISSFDEYYGAKIDKTKLGDKIDLFMERYGNRYCMS